MHKYYTQLTGDLQNKAASLCVLVPYEVTKCKRIAK